MINSLKTTTVRELCSVNIDKLSGSVLKISEALWENENSSKPNKFNALGSTKHIVFKFVNNLDSHLHYHERPLWLGWKGIIQPVLDQVSEMYCYKQVHFPRVMLAKLPKRNNIKSHIDSAKAALHPHKIHVPLHTHKDVYFCHSNDKYHFEVGKAYEVNNNIPHWTENNSDKDRIHLIFELFGYA